jgi:hypothetical protein
MIYDGSLQLYACTCISIFIFQSILYYYFICSIYDSNKGMTYLFWSPAKTNNFFGCLWLIDIKSVRSVSYDIFVQRVMVFNQQILLSSLVVKLITRIHLPCYCTVHVYVVIHYCDSMLYFESKRIRAGCVAIEDPIIKKGLGLH